MQAGSPHISEGLRACGMSQKRGLDSFFSPISNKRARTSVSPPSSSKLARSLPSAAGKEESGRAPKSEAGAEEVYQREIDGETSPPSSTHATYPFSVPPLPSSIASTLSNSAPAHKGKALIHLPDLDLLYYQPFIPTSTAPAIFDFLRTSLFYYRVKYKIKRGSVEADINTPRFTTVFGVDQTSTFDSSSGILLDATTKKPIEKGRYKTCQPRPLPKCLDDLKGLTEVFTGDTYNFCLVNYYANGNDSISYHSDDEKFLGPNPAIASFSLGANRDFLMRHKPVAPSSTNPSPAAPAQLKLSLSSGDMILMRGTTQANWLHSIPKRKGKEADKGRINITFRKAVVRAGTENYYRYNVGQGGCWKWDANRKEMVEWQGNGCVEGGRRG